MPIKSSKIAHKCYNEIVKNPSLLQKKHLIIVAISALLLIMNYRFSLGLLLGCASYYANYWFLEYKYTNLLSNSKVQMFIWSLLGIFILAFGLILSFLLPNIFSCWFVLIGIVLSKYMMIAEELRGVK